MFEHGTAESPSVVRQTEDVLTADDVADNPACTP